MNVRSTGMFRVPAVVAALMFAHAAFAEEGGSGHYLPGAMASFIDGVPAQETFVTRLNVVNYDGSVGGNVRVPIGGLTTLGADAKSWGYGLTLLVAARDRSGREVELCDEYHDFVRHDGRVRRRADKYGPAVGRSPSIVSDSQSGLGDLVLIPLMLNYNFDPDFNVEFRLTAYAPTGDYEVGRLANTGKNFWTAEPTLGLRYLGHEERSRGVAVRRRRFQ